MSSIFSGDLTNFIETVLVAIRQGLFFGVETRIPYAVTSILRPILFNKPSRPLKKQIEFFASQTIAHGWIIARIAVIFKIVESALVKLQGLKKPREWHTFVAGALAGYLIMGKDQSFGAMKKQINMAIGIRTIYALACYLVRTGRMRIPSVTHSAEGYENGTKLFYTLMWGVVMWHWRHQAVVEPGEMNIAQVNQMNFIYNDFPLLDKEAMFGGRHLPWLLLMLSIKQFA